MHLLKPSLAAIAAIALLTQTGCGPASDSPEGLMKQQLSMLHEMADAIEAGDTELMESLGKRQRELAKKMEEAKPDPEEVKRIQEKYTEQFKEASMRLAKAMQGQIQNLPMNFPLPTSP